MLRWIWKSRRARVATGIAAALALGVGAVLVGLPRDPWPPRFRIATDLGDCWNGFSPDGRAFGVGQAEHSAATDSWFNLATGQVQPRPARAESDIGLIAPDGQTTLTQRATEGEPPDPTAQEIQWVDRESRVIRRRCPLGNRRLAEMDFTANLTARLVLAMPEPSPAGSMPAQVVVWHLDTGATETRSIPAHLGWPLACSGDGRRSVHYDPIRGNLQVWDLDANQPLGPLIPLDSLENLRMAILPDRRQMTTLSPDGRTLALHRSDGRTEFWDLTAARLLRSVATHSAGEWSARAQFSRDGRTLASSAGRCTTASRFDLIWDWLARFNPAWTRTDLTEVALVDVATGQVLARAQGADQAEIAPNGRSVVTRESAGGFAVRDVPRVPPR